jgi:hypothetical protein
LLSFKILPCSEQGHALCLASMVIVEIQDLLFRGGRDEDNCTSFH